MSSNLAVKKQTITNCYGQTIGKRSAYQINTVKCTTLYIFIPPLTNQFFCFYTVRIYVILFNWFIGFDWLQSSLHQCQALALFTIVAA